MKTIYLARHAKSSWVSNLSVTDFDRPLDKRGEVDAVKIAKELVRLAWVPEKVIASPAIRSKQTCKVYCEKIGYPENDIEWNKDIYEAHTITLLQLLTSLDKHTQSVMLIGHNPAMENLLIHLCGSAKVNEHKQQDGKIFTTANIAKITTNVSWADLTMDEMHLEKLLRPKEL